jgi:hypothetical protein
MQPDIALDTFVHLVYIPQDGSLKESEFVVGMKLVTMCVTGELDRHALPSSLTVPVTTEEVNRAALPCPTFVNSCADGYA